MSDLPDSDDYPGLNLSQFTEEDFVKIDADVVSKFTARPIHPSTSFRPNSYESNLISKEVDELAAVISETGAIPQDEDERLVADASFRSDEFSLNLSELSAEELALLDAPIPGKASSITDKPAIEIELEGIEKPSREVALDVRQDYKPTSSFKRWHDRTPLERFRAHISLSVTDLVSPAWCEVQYDYGLRGKRSRPIKDRPKTFVSASGKTIAPAITVAKKNEVTTRQGLEVHKELEREIKFEELKVDITTPETRWALRLVNMIACMRGILDGFTREMPVFGIIHGDVVVGIMDEVVKVETLCDPDLSPDSKNSKRALDNPQSQTGAKKARIERPSWQIPIDRFFESPNKANGGRGTSSAIDSGPARPSWQGPIDRFFDSPKKANDSEDIPFAIDSGPTPVSGNHVGYTLHIKDNKTRRNGYLPSETDMYSGRMQLMIYRRLLSQLVAADPPYNFKPLWEKLNLDSSQIFPTKFLVQAQLIQENVEFQTACLDDLVKSWHKLVKESNIHGVDPHLELVYRLRPPPDIKGKRKAMNDPQTVNVSDEDDDLATAIAESLQETFGNQTAIAGPSKIRESASEINLGGLEGHATDATGSVGPLLQSEDAQLQWALQQSMLPQSPRPSESLEVSAHNDIPSIPTKKANDKAPVNVIEETGIRRFKVIGTKNFVYDDVELDKHLTQVLKWWRGERKPEGVSMEHSYRCSTCEYIEDCEWRAEKALSHINRNKP